MRKHLLVSLAALMLVVVCVTPGVTQQIAGFGFSGNELFSALELEQAVAPFKGQQATDQQLLDIKACLIKFYHDRGRLAQVEVTRDGEKIACKITESVAQVKVVDATAYSKSFIESHFRRIDNRKWTVPDLERAMLLLRDLPGLSAASASLQPSATTSGETDISINLGEGQNYTPRTYSLRFDNYGSPFVSRYRFVETVRDTNLTGRGDDLQFQLIHSLNFSDLLYGDLRFGLPISGDGTKLKAYLSSGDFEIGQSLAALGLTGSGFAYGLSATHPFVRTRTRSLTGELGLDLNDTSFDMDLGGTTVSLSEDHVRKLRLGGNWDWTEEGRARNLVSAYLHQGLGSFLNGTSGEGSDTGSRAGASNSFTKLAVQAARQQRLTNQAVLNVGLAGQYAFSTLLTAEEMSIGGADSVRGYPQSEVLGDSGVQANVELRYTPRGLTSSEGGTSWLQAMDLVTFLDYGAVFGRAGLGSENLAGAGLGFRAEVGSETNPVFVRLDLGYALDEHPSSGGRLQPYFRLEHQF